MRNSYPFNNRDQNSISNLVVYIILGPFFLLFSLLNGKSGILDNGINFSLLSNFPKLFERKITHIIYCIIAISLSITAIIFFFEDIWWMIAIIFVFHSLEFLFYGPILEFEDYIQYEFEFTPEKFDSQKKDLGIILNIWITTIFITFIISLIECFLPQILEREISPISYTIIILFTLLKVFGIFLLIYYKKNLDDFCSRNESFINSSHVKENQ